MIDVVVPAYREDPAVLAAVVAAAEGCPGVGSVVPVIGVRGKGAAMAVGLRSVATARVAFLDADLVGLRSEHVAALLAPPDGMTIGVVTGPSLLSGQRCLPTELAARARLAASGYGAEIRLFRAALFAGLPLRFVELAGVHHLSTEEKRRGLGLHAERWADVVLGLVT